MDLELNALTSQSETNTANHSFFIDGPAGRLEALLSRSNAPNTFDAVAVVCHPHPLYDGSLHNKVTYTLSRTLNDAGMPAIRFNFRGVGESHGSYAEGEGETEDLMCVIQHARNMFPDKQVWLAGFSFGAYISLRAARKADVSQLITVAPPVNFFNFAELRKPNCPWIVIQGDNDDVVPCDEVLNWLEEQQPAPELRLLGDVGHFFHRRLNVLRNTLEEYIQQLKVAQRKAG